MERHVIVRKLPRRVAPKTPPVRKAGLKYAFAGLSAGAGATTLAFAFADRLARAGGRSVSVVEISGEGFRARGSDYDKVGIDRRFAGREYVSCYDLLAHGGTARAVDNTDGGVNWMLRVPGESFAGFDTADYVRLSSGAPGDVVILDICGSFGVAESDADRPGAGEARTAVIARILRDCDRVFAVVDPLPSALMADRERLEMFKSMQSVGADIVFVVNKMNRGVDIAELRAFLKVRSTVDIPYLDPAGIYAAEYNCCTAYAMPQLMPTLEQAFAAMA
jgi:hypothetical protein